MYLWYNFYMPNNNSVTLKIGQVTFERIKYFYSDKQVENNGEYIAFFAKDGDTTITVYSSKKAGEYKVLFMGPHALSEAKIFDETAKINVPKSKAPAKGAWLDLGDQIGSDEVGTGDFFGPITVAAAYVKASDIKRLKELGVDDSKRLTDDKILEIGKVLINEFPYSQISLDNEKFNELVDKKVNMVEMKCKMHNQVLLNLHKKYPEINSIYVDEFVAEKNYYSYLFGTTEVVEKITFKTKGETYFPCVAVASIIARYSFLRKMEAIGEKYGVKIPFGASSQVTNFAKDFVTKFGKEELLKIVKKNFANLSEVV